jgi:hypothetical protein
MAVADPSALARALIYSSTNKRSYRPIDGRERREEELTQRLLFPHGAVVCR